MEKNITGRIHSVETFGAVDGPGVRYVVFFQGCPLRCIFCHNPDSWDFKGGREITAEELVEDIKRYKNFISGGGVTVSGGEPLAQADFAAAVLKGVKAEGLHTALDTSGALPIERCKKVLEYTDLVLLDIKALDASESKAISGFSNKNTLDMLNFCQEQGKEVWIRHILLPGFTLYPEKAHTLGKFLKDYSCVKKVELLPFHKMGEYKWETLKLEYSLGEVEPPGKAEVQEFADILGSYGLKT